MTWECAFLKSSQEMLKVLVPVLHVENHWSRETKSCQEAKVQLCKISVEKQWREGGFVPDHIDKGTAAAWDTLNVRSRGHAGCREEGRTGRESSVLQPSGKHGSQLQALSSTLQLAKQQKGILRIPLMSSQIPKSSVCLSPSFPGLLSHFSLPPAQ